jgi:hypothetical protein
MAFSVSLAAGWGGVLEAFWNGDVAGIDALDEVIGGFKLVDWEGEY